MLGRIFGKNKVEEKDASFAKKECLSKVQNAFEQKLREFEESEIRKKSFCCKREISKKINYAQKDEYKYIIPEIGPDGDSLDVLDNKKITKIAVLNDDLSESVTLNSDCLKLSWWKKNCEEWQEEVLFEIKSGEGKRIEDFLGRGDKIFLEVKSGDGFDLLLLERQDSVWQQKKNIFRRDNRRFVSMAVNNQANIVTLAVADKKNNFEIFSLENSDGDWKLAKKINARSGIGYIFCGEKNEIALCSTKNGELYFYRDWLKNENEMEIEKFFDVNISDRLLMADFVGLNSIIAVMSDEDYKKTELVLFNVEYTKKGKNVSVRRKKLVNYTIIKKIVGLRDGRFITLDDDGKVKIWCDWLEKSVPDGQEKAVGYVNDFQVLADGTIITVVDGLNVRVCKGSDGL